MQLWKIKTQLQLDCLHAAPPLIETMRSNLRRRMTEHFNLKGLTNGSLPLPFFHSFTSVPQYSNQAGTGTPQSVLYQPRWQQKEIEVPPME